MISFLLHSSYSKIQRKKEDGMAQVNWLASLEEGLSKARATNKLVFVDFFSPT